MVPLVMLHVYVAPMAAGTLAVLVELAQMLAGALIVASGGGFLTTLMGAEVPVHPCESVTLTV